MRLTCDEIETIRIHMNAFKEKLCNQGRWNDAMEYQRIVDKLEILYAELKMKKDEELEFQRIMDKLNKLHDKKGGLKFHG